jgi:hypothetical protein
MKLLTNISTSLEEKGEWNMSRRIHKRLLLVIMTRLSEKREGYIKGTTEWKT